MNHKRKKIISIIFWFLLFVSSFSSYSQTPFFRNVIVSKSISNLRINHIYQDHNKFIWLGTSAGLFRHNGVEFESIAIPDTMYESDISYIGDGLLKNEILIGFSSGKIISYQSGKFIPYTLSDTSLGAPVTGIINDNKGNLWISTYGNGLFRKKNNKIDHFKANGNLPDNYIYCILYDNRNNIWIGSDEGMTKCTYEGDNTSFINYTTDHGLPDNIIRRIALGVSGEIWIGTEEKGICYFDEKNKKFVVPANLQEWKYGPVNSLLLLENEFWVGSNRDGIIDYEFRGYKRFRKFDSENGFDGMNVNTMIKDHEGNIWVGAGTQLYFSPGEKIEFRHNFNNIPLSNIRTILIDSNDKLWFSNDSSLFCLFSDSSGKTTIRKPLTGTRYSDLNIISMYEDARGNLWMGTFDKGVLLYNLQSGKMRLYSEDDGLINSNILSIDGSDTEIWFATLGGVSSCKLTELENENGRINFNGFSEENGLGNNFIYKVFVDSKRRVWFGTDGKGITLFDGKKFVNYSEAQGLKSKVIYSITEDLKGNIWLSSINEGIYRFDGKSFRNFSLSQGLSEISVTSLITDKQGNIIIVHNNGIDVLDPVNNQIVYFGSEVGVSAIDPDLNVVDTDANGNIWIGTRNGIIKLLLGQRAGTIKPPIILNKVLSFLQEIDTTEQKSFAHNKNHISFDYTAIWYSDPQKISYQYKLAGYNNEWITTRDRFITFPNLLPGKYTFLLRTSQNGNFANSDIISYQFKINTPFWKQSWFILLSTLIIGSWIYLVVRNRNERFKSMERLKKEKAEYQYETLRNQVNPHFLFNSFNTLISIIENDKNVAIEYVNKLSDFFRCILTYRDKDLIPVSEELDMVKTYVFLQQKRFGQHLVVKTDISRQIAEKCFIPPLSLQILIENCLKHNAVSRETPILVEIFNENEDYIVVRNNINPRMAKEPSTGTGLQNIRNRYHIISGTLPEVTDDGIHFTVKLPLIKS